MAVSADSLVAYKNGEVRAQQKQGAVAAKEGRAGQATRQLSHEPQDSGHGGFLSYFPRILDAQPKQRTHLRAGGSADWPVSSGPPA